MPAVTRSRFVDPLPIAYATLALIGVGALMDMQRLAFLLSLPEASAAMMQLPHPRLHILVRLATITLFAMWVDRVWANLPALGAEPEHSRVAAILSFFVPPLCFFRPVQIVNEVWTTAERARHRYDRLYFRLAVAWWIAFLIPILLVVTGMGSDYGERWWRMVGAESFNIVAAVLAFPVIYLASQRQKAASRIPRASADPIAPAPPAIAPGYVAARTTTAPAPTAIAPSIARAPLPPRRPAERPVVRPVDRVVYARRGQRPALERSIDAVPPRAWQFVLVGSAAVAALALLVSGAILIQTPRDLAPALVQLGFASVIGAAAFAVSREKPQRGEGLRWAGRSAAGVVVTLIVLFGVAEGFL